MRGNLIFLFITVSSLAIVTAQECELGSNITNLEEYMEAIPEINSLLQECPPEIPQAAQRALGEGNVHIQIPTEEGETETFYFLLEDETIKELQEGTPTESTYQIEIPEETIVKLTNSQDPSKEILQAIQEKRIQIKPQTLWGKIKWFIIKLFLPRP